MRTTISIAVAALSLATFLPTALPASAEMRASTGLAAPFSPGSRYTVCFVPGNDCEGLVVASIAGAQRSVDVQAYSFTSPRIARSLVEAHSRGIRVRVLVDKSQRTERYTVATFLANAGVDVRVDASVAIAHNKVLIADAGLPQAAVLTGSFNFTRSAQVRNTENLVRVEGDAGFSGAYSANFESRWRQGVAP